MTQTQLYGRPVAKILIHTSVKLVTPLVLTQQGLCCHFNPHEREARDNGKMHARHLRHHFNPHEREARDERGGGKTDAGFYFNPHEREARDDKVIFSAINANILIHTSVKLVTRGRLLSVRLGRILIHTSVKLVTFVPGRRYRLRPILIHTSVKLVTYLISHRGHRHENFNPHEREARDACGPRCGRCKKILIHTSVKLVTSAGLLLTSYIR